MALIFGTSQTAHSQVSNGDIEHAKALIASGNGDAARALLEPLVSDDSGNVDLLFLLGMAAMASADHGSAIAWFRRALVHAPSATRIRLELARAFYLDRDYDNAFRQFQFARAGNPPAGVAASIDRYLAAIRHEKSWSYNFSIAFAPDTNINNATSEREAILFGLPFELSEDARRRSGVGLAIEGGAEFGPRIGKHARLRLGAAFQRREYKGKEFDDTTIALHAGPRLVLQRWDLSLVGAGFYRRFGRRRLNEGLGARLEISHYSDARTAISLGLTAQDIRYPHDPLRSGPAYSAWAGVVRALTASSSVTGRIGVSRKEARAADLASWSPSFAVGYYRDLPGGFSIYAEPSYVISRYDAPDALFGVRRRDRLLELRLAVLNRRIVLSRFTPRIVYTFARRQSTIDLYDFSQNRVEIGITSAF